MYQVARTPRSVSNVTLSYLSLSLLNYEIVTIGGILHTLALMQVIRKMLNGQVRAKKMLHWFRGEIGVANSGCRHLIQISHHQRF